MELANRLQALYKEQWREAYHEMNTWFKNKEAEIIYNLFRIIRVNRNVVIISERYIPSLFRFNSIKITRCIIYVITIKSVLYNYL